MAMDYLLIQASSVSCKRVFSSSSETDTKKCNCIKGLLMEALQMLKFILKRDHLSVNKHFPNTVEKDMNYNDLMCQMLFLLTFLLSSQMSLAEARCRTFWTVIAATEPRVAVDASPIEEVVTEE